jgi:hypothetical protein
MFLTDPAIIRQAYAPVLLERKAARILKSMDEEKASGVVIRISMDDTDRQYVRLIFIVVYAYISNSWKAIMRQSLIRPFKLFIYEPIVQLLGLYMAFLYGCLYCMRMESLPCMQSYTFQYSLRPYLRPFKTCITTEWALPAFTISLLVLEFRSHHKSTRG